MAPVFNHRLRALILRKQHDLEGALAEAAMALGSEPDSASMLALQSISLWELKRKKDALVAFRAAAKLEPKVATAEVFCRLVVCDANDIGAVSDFLRRNRWVLAPPPEPVTQHPIPDGSKDAAGQAPLPALNDSDMPILAALDGVVGAGAVKDYLIRENVVRRIVATIDNLPRQKLAAQKLPVVAVPGVFKVQGDELHATLDAQNYARYGRMVAVVRGLDMQRVADLYIHYYPLLQNAYQDLGYPTGYFNDRLVAVIDMLLATPQVTEPIDLVRPHVMYEYADSALEALPAGQKILIRMGPENAAVIKAKLTELRAIVTAAPIKR